MRSDFAVVGDSNRQDTPGDQNAQAGDNEPNVQLNEDEEDHQKFFKKMQECFSSTKKNGSSTGSKKSLDYVDNDERDNKSAAFSLQSEVNNNLRASLSDLADFGSSNSDNDNDF